MVNLPDRSLALGEVVLGVDLGHRVIVVKVLLRLIMEMNLALELRNH